MSVSPSSMPSTVSQMRALDDDVSSFASVDPVICLSLDDVSTEANKSLPNTNKPTQPRLSRIKTFIPKHAATDEVEKSKQVALSKKQTSQLIHSERNTNTVAPQNEKKSVRPILLEKSKKRKHVSRSNSQSRIKIAVSKTSKANVLSTSPLQSTVRRGSRSTPAETTTSQLASNVCYVK